MEIISVRLRRLKELDPFEKLLNENRSGVVRELVEQGRKFKALNLYKQRKVSLGLAAQLAGMPLGEFLDLLEEYDVKLAMSEDDAREALKHARDVLIAGNK